MGGSDLKIVMVAVMLGMTAFVLPVAAATPAKPLPKPNAVVVIETADDMIKGAETAPLTLIEYVSMTCVHCADFNEDILPQIEEKYIKTGKVRYIQRDFLTAPIDVGMDAVLLARCAGRDKYFEIVDAVMRSQRFMFFDGTTDNARPVLLNIAKQAGLSEAQFEACTTDLNAQMRVHANIEKYLTEHHVTSTPTFFINGVEFERKTGDFAEFERAFAALGVK